MIELLVGLFLLALVAAVFILPVVALVRTRGIGLLRRRLDALEEEVTHLRRRLRDLRAAPPPTAAEPEPAPLEALPAAEEPAPPAPARRRALAGADAGWLESWIGQRGLGWAAVVLLFFATAFFLKYAFDNQWIGELGRVSLGVVAGAALCAGGLAAHRRQRRLASQMLTSAGVILLYLTTFAAFGYYHLMPRERAGLFLVAVVAESAALAVLYDAPAIAILAVVGGLLSPVLLHSDQDQYRSLFTYLAVLNAGVVGLALFRRWVVLAPLSLAGTQVLYWGWYFGRYHPEKLGAALSFQVVVFALFVVHDVLAPAWKRQRAHPVQLVQIVANGFLFVVAGYALLDWDYHQWLPALAVGLAIVYAALAGLVQQRSPGDGWLQLGVITMGMGLVAVAVALRAEAGWVSLGWGVEGLALWWFGLRIRALPMRALGAVLLALAVGRLVLVDTPWGGRGPFVPLFNNYALPGLAITGCVLAGAWATRRLGGTVQDFDRAAWWLMGLGGVLLGWLVLSVEVYQSASRWLIAGTEGSAEQYRFAQMCLSVFWAVYAGGVLAVGFRVKSRPVRATALGLFALTLGKVVLLDMAGLPGIYRVAAFFALAVIMGLGAWGYQRLEAGLGPARREEAIHEGA
jgi:uncharacterized membrane protein